MKNYTKFDLEYFLKVQVGIQPKYVNGKSLAYLEKVMDFNNAWGRFYREDYVEERVLANRLRKAGF